VDNSFELLKNYLENKPASVKAVEHLSHKFLISIVLDGSQNTSFSKMAKKPCLDLTKAKDPDVEFLVSKKALDLILQNPGVDVGELGVDVVRQVLKGEIKIRLTGSVLGLFSKGYIKLIGNAGPAFTSELSKHGFKSIGKLKSVFEKLRG
jgi:hypothetical protein